MSSFQIKLNDVQDQLKILNSYVHLSYDLESYFHRLDVVVKTWNSKIQDIKQDVEKHDVLIKNHENLIRGGEFQSRGEI